MQSEKEIRKLAAVMFTDIEGYTALVGRDEAEAIRVVGIHRGHLAAFTAQYGGQVIQFYGDGSLSIYDSAVQAVECAIAMQQAYRLEGGVAVRIGIHVGDIAIKGDSVFGDGVNLAARVQALGVPGSVLLSEKVRAELQNHPRFQLKSIGRHKLKNVPHPVEVFAVSDTNLTIPQRKSVVRRWVVVPAGLTLLAVVALLLNGRLSSEHLPDDVAGDWTVAYYYSNDTNLIFRGTLSLQSDDLQGATMTLFSARSDRSLPVTVQDLRYDSDRRLIHGMLLHEAFMIRGGYLKESFHLTLGPNDTLQGYGKCEEYCAEGTALATISWVGQRQPLKN